MAEAEKISSEISLDTYEIESMHIVDVTYIIDPHHFYIRSTKYREIVHKFESTVPNVKVTTVNIGDIVLYNWGQSCGAVKYIRGKVLNVVEAEGFFDFDLFAIDYGFVEKTVPREFLWQCKDEFNRVPPLAIICQLGNCFPPGVPNFPPHSIEGFKFYAGNEQSKMQVLAKVEEKLIVKLVNSNPEDVATMLAKGAYTKLGHAYDEIMWHPTSVRKQQQFTFRKLTINEKLHVKVLAGSSLEEFYVAELQDYRRHLKEKNNITFYARQEFRLIPGDVVEGMILCMRDESRNMYERGLLKKLLVSEECNAIVHLADQGVDVEVPITILKYMPAMCLRTPVLAIYCTADKSQAWDNGLENFLTPGFEFIITIKKLGYQFDCPNVVNLEPLEESPRGAGAVSPSELLFLLEEKEDREREERLREERERDQKEREERKRAKKEAAKESKDKAAEELGAAALPATAALPGAGALPVAVAGSSKQSDDNAEGAVGPALTEAEQKAYDEAFFMDPI